MESQNWKKYTLTTKLSPTIFMAERWKVKTEKIHISKHVPTLKDDSIYHARDQSEQKTPTVYVVERWTGKN